MNKKKKATTKKKAPEKNKKPSILVSELEVKRDMYMNTRFAKMQKDINKNHVDVTILSVLFIFGFLMLILLFPIGGGE